MATIINSPGERVDDSGSWVVVGILIALVLVVMFFVFGLPYLRDGYVSPRDTSGNTEINVQVPLVPQEPSGTGN